MNALTRLLLAPALVLALAACGNDDGDDTTGATPAAGLDNGGSSTNGEDDEAAPQDDDSGDDNSGSFQPPAGSGSGTLVVAGTTFEFDVIFCGFDADATGNEDVAFSMRGRGTTDDGTRYEVDAAIVEIGGTEVHSVSLWIGDSFPFDVTYESERMNLQGTVMGTGERSTIEMGLDWPLLEIAGKTVNVDGAFYRYEGTNFEEEDVDLVGRGTLQLTCP